MANTVGDKPKTLGHYKKYFEESAKEEAGALICKQISADVILQIYNKKFDENDTRNRKSDENDTRFCLSQLEKLMDEHKKLTNPSRVNAGGNTDKKIESKGPTILQTTSEQPLLKRGKELLNQVKPLAKYFENLYHELHKTLVTGQNTIQDLSASAIMQATPTPLLERTKDLKAREEDIKDLLGPVKDTIEKLQAQILNLEENFSAKEISDGKRGISIMGQLNQEYLKSKDLCDQLTINWLIANLHQEAVQWKIKQLQFVEVNAPKIGQLAVNIEKLVLKVEDLKKISPQTALVQDELKKYVYPPFNEYSTSVKDFIPHIEWLKKEIADSNPENQAKEKLKEIEIYDSILNIEIPKLVLDNLQAIKNQKEETFNAVKPNWTTIENQMGSYLPPVGLTIVVRVQKALPYEINRLTIAVEKNNGVLPADSTRGVLGGWTYEKKVSSPFEQPPASPNKGQPEKSDAKQDEKQKS